jgi:hypothetical protein
MKMRKRERNVIKTGMNYDHLIANEEERNKWKEDER